MVAFPGDSHFQCKQVHSVELGHVYSLCHMSLGNHTGTHVDFPCHVVPGGKNSDHFPIEHLMGDGLIIELNKGEKSVSRQFLQKVEFG